MALELPYGYKNLNPEGSSNVDEAYGYYDSIAEALQEVPLAMRKGGRTVGIKDGSGKITEYWWENDNDLSDEGLVEKTSGSGGGGGGDFNPAEHDLDEFQNESSNPYARMDDLPPPFDPTDLEIGGRNLLLNSNFKTTSFNGWSTIYGTQQITENGYLKTYTSDESAARIQKSFTLSEIGTFTFSVKVKTSVAINWSGWTDLSILDIKVKQIEDDFEIHSITFSNSIAGTKTIRGYQPNAPIGTTVLIEWEQLERGNVATDWTPAPEDLVTDWDETDENSFSFLKNKPTIPDEFIPAEHDLDEFKNQSINPFARKDDLPPEFHPDDYDLNQFNNESQDPFVRSSELLPPFDPEYLEDAISDLENNKQDNLEFIPENSENKAEALTEPDNVTYPTTKAVADALEKKDIIRTSNTVINAGWSGHDIITNGHNMTVNPISMDYPDSFEVYLYNNSANDSAIVLNAKAGVTYTVIDNDVSSATVYLQAFGTAVIKRISNTQNYIIRGYII